jgi:CrcB protein
MADDRVEDPMADHAATGQDPDGSPPAAAGWGDLPVDPDVAPSDLASFDPASSDLARSASAESGVPAPLRPRGRARARYLSRRIRRVVRHRADVLAVIAAGGAAGSLARWGLTQILPHPAGAFPWATFIANVSGCLLLGVLMVFVIEVWPPSRYVRPFLGVGVFGGYTTFSTYMLDARGLLVSGRAELAGMYVFGTLAAGLAAVWAGVTGARLLVRLARRRRARIRPTMSLSTPSSSTSSSPSAASMTRST